MTIEINIASICPLFLILLSVLQSITFFSSAQSSLNEESETAFSSNDNMSREEYSKLFSIHGKIKLCILPFLAIFIFFFSTILKIVVPVLIYILSFVISKIIFIVIKKHDKNNY